MRKRLKKEEESRR